MNALTKTFNLPDEDAVQEIKRFIEIEIPANATTKDIVKLSLEAYAAQIESLNAIEPRYRPRGMEVAHQYLETAMEAIARDRELQLKREKLEYDMKKKATDKDGKEMLLEEGGVPRDTLLKEITEDKRQLH